MIAARWKNRIYDLAESLAGVGFLMYLVIFEREREERCVSFLVLFSFQKDSTLFL